MASKFFDDIYENKLEFNSKKIYQGITNDKEAKPKKEKIEYNQQDLEFLLEKSRQNPDQEFTEEEAEAINQVLDKTKTEAKKQLKRIKDLKSFLENSIKDDPEVFELSIKNNQALKRHSNNVFGGNKNKITYQDYLTLLEMRKQIMLNETASMVAGVDVDELIQ